MFRWLVVLLVASGWLGAQEGYSIGKGWQLTLLLQPEFTSRTTVDPFVTAADTLPLRLRSRFPNLLRGGDTIVLNGQEKVYYVEEELVRPNVRRSNPTVNLALNLRLQRQFRSGLNLSLAAYYSSAIEDTRVGEIDDLPDDFLYYSFQDKTSILLGSVHLDYHFRRSKRLQPYVGGGIGIGYARSRLLEYALLFPNLGEEITILDELPSRFRDQEEVFSGFKLQAGFIYLLSEHLALGVEFAPGSYSNVRRNGPILAQVRYLFGGKQQTDDRR